MRDDSSRREIARRVITMKTEAEAGERNVNAIQTFIAFNYRKEPFWILSSSFIVIALACDVSRTRRIFHPFHQMFAIAAMTRHGRVIGRAGRTPWHLPAELRWFKQATTGAAVLMGRKTLESIGRLLPNRLNLVVTHRPLPPGIGGPDVRVVPDLVAFRPEVYRPRQVWVIGGAEVFTQVLPRCEAVFLSLIDQEVAGGDTFFPAFENDFPYTETILREPGFEVVRFGRTPGNGFSLSSAR